ncbi:MAG: MFS transporter [Nocardioides sp.]
MRRLPLYGWLSAEAISLLGTRVSMIAIPWLVLVTTGSATRTGIVAAAELTPLVLLKAFGGPLVDRVGPRRVAITCDSASLVVVGLIPLLHASGHLTFPALLVLVALAGGLRGPGDAATAALIPSLVASAGVSFERATGLSSAIERGATMIGAAIAGGLVATIGAANAVAVDAVSFGLCALVLLGTTGGLPRVTQEPTTEPTSYAGELRDGWHFLRHEPVLMSLSLMVAVTNLLDLAWSAVLMPVWARETGAGVGALGLVFAVWGGASMVGSLIAARWGERLPRFATYVVAFLVTGLPRFAFFALGVPVWAILAMSLVGGCASGFLNPVLGAVIYERIPPHLVGRVTSLNTALCWSLMPLGGVLGGVLVTGFGFVPAVLAVGVAYFATTMAPTLLPRFREMDRPAVTETMQPA